MGIFSIQLSGLNNIQKKMQGMASNEKIEKMLDLLALEVEREAKIRCPVRTGRLRNSITTAKKQKERYVGTSVSYAPYVHNGTYKMAARPFLLQAFLDVKRRYAAIAKKIL